MSANKSNFGSTTGASAKPLWVLRGFSIAAILPLLLAMLVFKSGNAHNFCVGLSVGILVGLIVQTFAISSIELDNTPQASDVDNISVIR